MDAAEIPRITIWNKIDAVGDPAMVRSVAAGREAVVCCSAATGEGIPELLEAMERHLAKRMVLRRALIPFSQARVREGHPPAVPA
jgi:GTP-binding protein HflX